MSWVDPRYISVDNGILTFLAPSAAVVPAATEDAAKRKEKKPKENLPTGVPALGTVINAYITDYGGGSVDDLKARIKYHLKNKQTDIQATKVIASLKKYLETWFHPFDQRGKRVKGGKWEIPYQPPDLDDIQAQLGVFLQEGHTWKDFLKAPKKPASEEEQSSEEYLFDYFAEIVQRYTSDIDEWLRNDKKAWDQNAIHNYHTIFKIMKLLQNIKTLENDVRREGVGMVSQLYPTILKHITLIKMHIENLRNEEIDKEDQVWKDLFTSDTFNTRIDALYTWVEAQIQQYKEQSI